MSAFIVDDQTINTVVNYLYLKVQHNPHYWPAKEIIEAGYDLLNDENATARLADEMFKLNILAIDERYGQGEAKKFRDLDFTYKFGLSNNPVQVFKSLQCWLYQCSEGMVPDMDLYNLMDEVQKLLAIEIVTDLPAYQKAEWA